MGRFSKLETGGGASPDDGPDEGASGLRTRVRNKPGAPARTGIDYDQGHYVAEGDRFLYSGDYQKALRAYSRAMQVDHSAIEPWVGQVIALVRQGQAREAAMWAMRAVELFPQDPRLLSLQGLTLALNGSRQRAISCSDFAMSQPGGGSAFAWMVRGQILAISDNANAAFCFDKVMETREPGDWRILALTGEFLLEQKKWARALEFLRPATEANPSNGWLWKRLGFANERLGLSQPAMQAYRAAAELNPNDRDAHASVQRLGSIPLPVRIWRRMTGSR